MYFDIFKITVNQNQPQNKNASKSSTIKGVYVFWLCLLSRVLKIQSGKIDSGPLLSSTAVTSLCKASINMSDNENNSNDNIIIHIKNTSSYLHKEDVKAINLVFKPNLFEPETYFDEEFSI